MVADKLMGWATLVAVSFPIAYGLLILWAVNHRFRSTTRNLLIAMTLIALVIGLTSALITSLTR